MIYWSNENGEGSFQSKFFQDDEHKHKLSIYINDDKLKECAEKCVESFNNLTDNMIDEICTQLWENVKDELKIKTHYESLDIAGSNRIHYVCFSLPAQLPGPEADEELKNYLKEYEQPD